MNNILCIDRSNAKRNEMIDFIRGGAILLVMIQHCGAPFAEIILSFHMPFFFLLSGFLYNYRAFEKRSDFASYFRNQFRRLIIPYLWFELVNLLVSCIIEWLTQRNVISIGVALKSIILCLNMADYPNVVLRLWFLPCMFITSLLAYAMIHILQKKYIQYLVVILGLLGLSWMIAKLNIGRFPFTIDISIMGLAFVLIGYVSRPHIENIVKNIGIWKGIFFSIILMYITSCLVKGNTELFYMYKNSYGLYFLAIPAALIGSSGFLLILIVMYQMLKNEKSKLALLIRKYFLWLGRNSITIFPSHLLILYFSTRILHLFHINSWYIVTVSLIILVVPVVNIINEYFPFMIGNQWSKKYKHYNDS